MSTTLFVLVVLQGTTASLSAPATPPQRSVCSNTRGRTLLASPMTEGTSWTAFFKTSGGGFGLVGRISKRRRVSEIRRCI